MLSAFAARPGRSLVVALTLAQAGCGNREMGSVKVDQSPAELGKSILSPPGIRVAPQVTRAKTAPVASESIKTPPPRGRRPTSPRR